MHATRSPQIRELAFAAQGSLARDTSKHRAAAAHVHPPSLSEAALMLVTFTLEVAKRSFWHPYTVSVDPFPGGPARGGRASF